MLRVNNVEISSLMAPRQKDLNRIVTLKGKHSVHAGCLCELYITRLKRKSEGF